MIWSSLFADMNIAQIVESGFVPKTMGIGPPKPRQSGADRPRLLSKIHAGGMYQASQGFFALR